MRVSSAPPPHTNAELILSRINCIQVQYRWVDLIRKSKKDSCCEEGDWTLLKCRKQGEEKTKTNSKQEARRKNDSWMLWCSRESDCCCCFLLFLQESLRLQRYNKNTNRKENSERKKALERGKRMTTGGDKLNQSHRKSLKKHTHTRRDLQHQLEWGNCRKKKQSRKKCGCLLATGSSAKLAEKRNYLYKNWHWRRYALRKRKIRPRIDKSCYNKNELYK